MFGETQDQLLQFMLFSEQLLAMLSSKMALCTLTKIFWNILDNSSVFVCFCGGYRTLSHNPISFTLVISKINGDHWPWALPSRRTARPPRSARGTKKQDQPWASGLQLLTPLLGFCLGSKGWRQQNMGKTQQWKLGIQRWCFSMYKLVHHQLFTIFWCSP